MYYSHFFLEPYKKAKKDEILKIVQDRNDLVIVLATI